MTAFARAEEGAAVWEIRSVNHRYLDVSFRMPENLRHMEQDLKALMKDRLQRGKVECSLKINSAVLGAGFVVNEPLLAELGKAVDRVKQLTSLDNPGDALSLLRWPDVITPEDTSDSVSQDVISAFDACVAALMAMREREGAELSGFLEQRLQDIESTVEIAREEAPLIVSAQHEKLRKRIDELNTEVDPARLEQELVILAQKLDVAEELDRLGAHVAEVRRALETPEPVGRRLDFLMQELNREANTLSSKAAASTTTLKAVDLKVIIEQMREQVQNIE